MGASVEKEDILIVAQFLGNGFYGSFGVATSNTPIRFCLKTLLVFSLFFPIFYIDIVTSFI